MEHRWADVNLDAESDEHHTKYLGGVGNADLWSDRNVLICQYPHDNYYVSYFPPGAVVDHVMGVLTYENARRVQGIDVRTMNPPARTVWTGTDEVQEVHKPEEVALYVAIFCPDLFTEEERNQVLGHVLAEPTKTVCD